MACCGAIRSIFDVAPFYFHIVGKPETGGVVEEHTTLFPFFHYGYSEDESLFVLPGYLRRTTKTVDTMLSLVYSHATTRSGATSMTAAGPIVPLWFDYHDKDIGTHARQAITRLLRCPVHLRLVVRVRQNWRERDALLRDLGFKEE